MKNDRKSSEKQKKTFNLQLFIIQSDLIWDWPGIFLSLKAKNEKHKKSAGLFSTTVANFPLKFIIFHLPPNTTFLVLLLY